MDNKTLLKIKEKIILLVPAYNPDEKMIDFINATSEFFDNIVVVNDGCSEEYNNIFDKVKDKVILLKHEINKGKGRALKTGFSYIKENMKECTGVVTADADGQHTCDDVLGCCEDFINNPIKAVFGCRDFYSDTRIPPRSRFGNRLTSRLMKFFCDIKLSDTQTGLRVLPLSRLEDLIKVEGDRYEYEMNMIFALKDMGTDWVEHKISVIYIDDNSSSHFNPIKDSIKIYKIFLKFCISSFGSSVLDLIIFTIASYFLVTKGYLNLKIDGIYVSTAIARICSGIFNYCVNKIIFVGRSKKTNRLSGAKYMVVWFVQMMLSAFIVANIYELCPFIHQTIIKIIVDTILFFISYKIQQKWVFK